MAATSRPDCTIDVPYLLALNVGLLCGPDGAHYADRSWAKDLVRHTAYIPRLTVVAPITRGVPTADHEPLPAGAMRIVGYPAWRGRIGAYAGMAVAALKLLREVPRARIVHTCVAGYPFPLGWIAVPLARATGRKAVITVESSFWRIPAGERPGAVRRLRAGLWERLNRWCMAQTDYASYSHEGYRRSLPAPRAGGGVLFQASWIEADQVRSADEVDAMWAERRAASRRPRFLFAARMVPEKGTAVLADAIGRLAAADADLGIDLIGAGPELARFLPLVDTAWGRDHLRILEPVPYGPAFFALLRDYDAVLVPSLSDEQPRIVYDGYAEGVPTIGSDVPGVAACVSDGETGRLVPPADAAALTDAILAAAADPGTLAAWGRAGRALATRFTHDHMHAERCRDLQRLL